MKLLNKTLYLLLSFTFCLSITSYGQDWEIGSDVQRINDRNILVGYIDSTYKIKMVFDEYSEPSFCDDTANMAIQWLNKTLSGWYSYETVGEKIPLIGAYNPSDGGNFIRLYVPKNYTDSLTREDCDLDSFREVFFNPDYHTPTKMFWFMQGTNDTLPVDLTYIEKESPKTIASFTLNFFGWPIKTISLTELSNLDYIMSIWNLDYNQVNGKYFMTFEFTEPAVPGGSGGGAGGMDFNSYLGFIHLDNELNLIQYEQKHLQRGALLLDRYEAIEGKPELGLIKKEE